MFIFNIYIITSFLPKLNSTYIQTRTLLIFLLEKLFSLGLIIIIYITDWVQILYSVYMFQHRDYPVCLNQFVTPGGRSGEFGSVGGGRNHTLRLNNSVHITKYSKTLYPTYPTDRHS